MLPLALHLLALPFRVRPDFGQGLCVCQAGLIPAWGYQPTVCAHCRVVSVTALVAVAPVASSASAALAAGVVPDGIRHPK